MASLGKLQAINRNFFLNLIEELKCNYNAASINNGLPTFYRELLQNFQEFKDKTNIFLYDKFLLWNNEVTSVDKEISVQEEHPLCTRYPKS